MTLRINKLFKHILSLLPGYRARRARQQARLLQQALSLAEQGRGFCAPNPAVGAIVVNAQGGVVGEGYHHAPGQPHAEVHAIEQAGSLAKGATIYVTLQPCCHHGKTPPCTDLIISSGIRHVVYAFRDLNPEVADHSDAALDAANITREQMPVEAINRFYQSYAHWWQQQRPWLTAKIAISADGKIAAADGKPVVISGNTAKQFTHQGRLKSDAILTTVKTIIHDDPQLNVRLDEAVIAKPVYVLDTKARLPLSARVLQTAKNVTLFYAENAANIDALTEKGVRCIRVAASEQGVDLTQVIDQIGEDGMHDLWVEAGGHCLQSLLQAQLINRLYVYIASQPLGTQALAAFRQSFLPWLSGVELSWQSLGDDQLLVISECSL